MTRELAGARPVAALRGNLEAFGWGLFMIWAGTAIFLDLGWGWGLLGVGIIALGMQAARRYLGFGIDLFGLMMGVAFTLWGIWELAGDRLGPGRMPIGLLPTLCIVVGAVLVGVALLRKPPQGRAQ